MANGFYDDLPFNANLTLLGQFDQNQAVALNKQKQRHQEMLQSIQKMQAQQANANQMLCF